MIYIDKEIERDMIEFPIKKPPPSYRFDLDMSLSLGYIAGLDETGQDLGYTWIPISDSQSRQDHLAGIALDHLGINLKIKNDSDVLLDLDLGQDPNIKIHTQIEFGQDTQDRGLSLTFSGFSDRHMPLTAPNVSARSAIRLDSLRFEDLDIMPMYEQHSTFQGDGNVAVGVTLFTCSGVCEFVYQTPIYSWLIQNRSRIVWSQ